MVVMNRKPLALSQTHEVLAARVSTITIRSKDSGRHIVYRTVRKGATLFLSEVGRVDYDTHVPEITYLGTVSRGHYSHHNAAVAFDDPRVQAAQWFFERLHAGLSLDACEVFEGSPLGSDWEGDNWTTEQVDATERRAHHIGRAA